MDVFILELSFKFGLVDRLWYGIFTSLGVISNKPTGNWSLNRFRYIPMIFLSSEIPLRWRFLRSLGHNSVGLNFEFWMLDSDRTKMPTQKTYNGFSWPDLVWGLEYTLPCDVIAFLFDWDHRNLMTSLITDERRDGWIGMKWSFCFPEVLKSPLPERIFKQAFHESTMTI